MAFSKCCMVLALVAAALTTVSGQAQTFPLEPFTSISVCLPFNVQVGALQTPTYQLVVDADPGVAAAINASVVNGALTLELAENIPRNTLAFQAPNPVKVAVQLPADQLASLAISAVPSIVVAVGPGFVVPGFAASISGTSTLTVQGLQAEKVDVVNAGTGTIHIAGTINTASITASGTGSTYVLGVAQSAAVGASGISKVYITGAAETQITGQVSGISSVYYDQGICTVSSEFGGIFGSPCTQQPVAPPSFLTSPQWSCALTVYGTFGCSDAAASGTSSSQSSSSSSSSTGGTGNTFSSTTVDGVTTTTTGSSGPDGTSSLVTNTGTLQIGACPMTGIQLNIFPAA